MYRYYVVIAVSLLITSLVSCHTVDIELNQERNMQELRESFDDNYRYENEVRRDDFDPSNNDLDAVVEMRNMS